SGPGPYDPGYGAGSIRERLSAVRPCIRAPDRPSAKTARGQTQRRTFTPPTHAQRQAATTGLRTTTAPRAPAQPARTTPRAQTTALASVVSKVMVAEKDSTAAAISRKERMLVSRTGTG